jgi:hypothetical protein
VHVIALAQEDAFYGFEVPYEAIRVI